MFTAMYQGKGKEWKLLRRHPMTSKRIEKGQGNGEKRAVFRELGKAQRRRRMTGRHGGVALRLLRAGRPVI